MRLRLHTFTLIEILAALLIVAIVVPVAVHGLQLANQVGQVAERKEQAARLGNNYLNEIVRAETWEDVEESGDFGEDWPGYSWTLEANEWNDSTSHQLLTLTVHYQVQSREKSVELSTLVPLTVEGGEE